MFPVYSVTYVPGPYRASPSRAIALRARNGMLLRRREAGWGAQEMSNQSVC